MSAFFSTAAVNRLTLPASAECDALIAAGYHVDWHVYPMQHEVVLEEIKLVGEFLTSVLG